jgi:hypothetical protein
LPLLLSLVLSTEMANSTLIIESPTDDGVIFCADRRVSMMSVHLVKDTNVKIFKLGPRCAYAITGIASLWHVDSTKTKDNARVFLSLHAIVEAYFKRHSCSQATVDEHNLGTYVSQNVNAILGERIEKVTPAPSFIILVHADAFDTLEQIYCEVQTDGSRPSAVQTSCTKGLISNIHHKPGSDSGRSAIYGDTRVAAAEYQQKTLGLLNTDPTTERILRSVGNARMMAVPEATTIARAMIRNASRVIIAGETMSSISLDCDCMHMPLHGAFTWLNKPITTGLFGRPDRVSASPAKVH